MGDISRHFDKGGMAYTNTRPDFQKCYKTILSRLLFLVAKFIAFDQCERSKPLLIKLKKKIIFGT